MAAPDGESAASSMTVSIPAPRDRQDEVVREAIAPLFAALRGERGLEALHFQRLNKPEWRLLLYVAGDPAWLAEGARPTVELSLRESERRGVVGGFEFVPEVAEDKWVGGGAATPVLRRMYLVDSLACLDLMAVEARGALSVTRAEWSLLLVERMLDLFGLEERDRLEFYERGFRWAHELGRWGDDVLQTLEAQYQRQRDALEQVLRRASGEEARTSWGGAEASRIARRCLEAWREPIETFLASDAGDGRGAGVLDVAVFLGHAHSNRLGIHATQEALMRWLVHRARREARDGR